MATHVNVDLEKEIFQQEHHEQTLGAGKSGQTQERVEEMTIDKQLEKKIK